MCFICMLLGSSFGEGDICTDDISGRRTQCICVGKANRVKRERERILKLKNRVVL